MELPDVVYALRLEPDTGFEYVSPSVEDLVGYSPEECYADPALGSKLLDPRDTDKFTAATRAGLNVPVEFTVRWRSKEGRTVWTSHRGHKRRRDDGSVVLFGSVRDVTAERGLTDHLFAAQNKYRLLAENSSDVVFRLEPDGAIRWVSRNVAALLGWPRWDVVGQSVMEFIHSEDISKVEVAPSTPAGHEHAAHRLRVRTHDGRYRWLDVSITAIHDDQGQLVGYVGSGVDAQEQALAALELARVSDQLRLVLENTADVILQIAPDGTLMWVSPSIRTTLGWDPKRILGTRFRLAAPQFREVTAEISRNAISEHADGFSCRLQVVCADGSQRWADTRNILVWSEDGTLDSIVVSLRDITETVEAEEKRAAMLDSMLDPHVLLHAVRDAGGTIVDFIFTEANQAACDYMQRSRGALLGARLLTLLPGLAPTGMFAQYAHAVDSGEPLVLDDCPYLYEVLQDERHYDIRGVKVGDALSFTWRDVTDRHATAVALAASEERLKSLVANAASGLVIHSSDGRIVDCNPAAEAMLGLTRDQVLGRTSIDPQWRTVHPDGSDFPGDEHPAMVTLRTGQAVRDVVMGVHTPAGVLRWLNVTTIPYSLPGAMGGESVLASFADITETMAAQQSLATDHDRLRTILDYQPDPHVFAKAIRDEAGRVVDFRVTHANDAAGAFTGASTDVLVGSRASDILPWKAGSELLDRFVDVIETGEPLQLDDFCHRLDLRAEQQRYFDIRAVRIGDSLFYTWRDVTDRHTATSALAAAEQRYRLVAENAADAVIVVNLSGQLEWASPAVERVLGYWPEDLRGFGTFPVHPEDVYRGHTVADEIRAGADAVPWELRVKTATGEYRWMSAMTSPVRDESETLTAMITTLRDIHQQVLDRMALALSEQTFRAAMIGAPQGMAVVALHGSFLQTNQMLADLLGYDDAWLTSHKESDLVHPDDLESDLMARDRLLAGTSDFDIHEERLVVASGRTLWVQHSVALVRDEYGMPMFYVSNYEDITDAQSNQGSLTVKAHHDPLTGLSNREQLRSRLAGILESPSRLTGTAALLYCDLDFFQVVNDSFGRDVGDVVLREVATRIAGTLSAGAEAARLSGDEFAVVLPHVADIVTAERVAERVRDAVAQPLEVGTESLSITMSVGVAAATPAIKPHRLLRNAEVALHRAKNQGRDRTVVYH